MSSTLGAQFDVSAFFPLASEETSGRVAVLVTRGTALEDLERQGEAA